MSPKTGFYDKLTSSHNRNLMKEEEGLPYATLSMKEGSDWNRPWLRNKIVTTTALFIALLISGACVRTLGHSPTRSSSNFNSFSPWYNGDELLSNGTHEFKRTVLIVSIDGLRADYLDRGLTPNLLHISQNGLRAKSIKPVFPSQTFPNHWALMTGLHAESHGIVANYFWDPNLQETFSYHNKELCKKPEWWLGEPMWETARKAGLTTANLMWPGPPKTTSGTNSTYFVGYKNYVPLSVKLDQILEWIDYPVEGRPQLIMAYEPSLDQAGHAAGPMSALVNRTLGLVDGFAKDLQLALFARNLTDIVDVIFVSDHGMTDTSHPELIYLDDIIGNDGVKAVDHRDGWPSFGFRFHTPADESHYLEMLLAAAKKNPEKFEVFTHETMPERFHFTHNERIAPIYVVPKIGYVLTTKAEGDTGFTLGSHGYDNDELSMHGMFVAHGPFSTDAKALHRTGNKVGDHWLSTGDGAYIMERFRNVEVYNLVIKLLGIEKSAAPNNGTVGFWDKYL